MKKTSIALLAVLLIVSALVSCSDKDAENEVYYLNFKPEVAEIYSEEIAPVFEEETGIPLKVVTAASNQYTQTLKSEMAKSQPPVIFQVNGPMDLMGSKNDVAPLENTEFYKLLSDKSMALELDGHVVGIPYVVEGYGIIYNNAIMEKYFALPTNSTGVKSMDEIDNFETLKAVVEDMTANKDALGIQGVFASTSMSAGNDWRWTTHLLNPALFAEYGDVLTGQESTTFDFAYSDNFKALFDLYLDNSTTARGLVGSKSVDDSMAEFALGQCAMVQNGSWGASQILGVPGNTVADEDIKFLPLYMGLDDEEEYGLCVGTENYLCINKNVSEELQKNADTFLTWLFSSDTGKKFVGEKLVFITPFNTFNEDETPQDPLAKDMVRWMNKDGITQVPTVTAAIPSEQWKADFGSALLGYINNQISWDDVVKTAQDSWAKEAEIMGR